MPTRFSIMFIPCLSQLIYTSKRCSNNSCVLILWFTKPCFWELTPSTLTLRYLTLLSRLPLRRSQPLESAARCHFLHLGLWNSFRIGKTCNKKRETGHQDTSKLKPIIPQDVSWANPKLRYSSSLCVFLPAAKNLKVFQRCRKI